MSGRGLTDVAKPGEEQEDENEPSTLSQDGIYEVLKNERRRLTLGYLQEQGGPIDLGDLAEHVAIVENDTSQQMLTSTDLKRAYVGLYQCHLRKMDELGVVEFNRDRGLIELGPTFDQVEPYLDSLGESRQWWRYYLWASAGGLVLLLGSVTSGVLDLVPMPITLVVTCTVILLLFGGLALVHTAEQYGIHNVLGRLNNN